MKISQAILTEELAIFEKKFREAVKSNVPLLEPQGKAAPAYVCAACGQAVRPR
jgi:hypothetical protein